MNPLKAIRTFFTTPLLYEYLQRHAYRTANKTVENVQQELSKFLKLYQTRQQARNEVRTLSSQSLKTWEEFFKDLKEHLPTQPSSTQRIQNIKTYFENFLPGLRKSIEAELNFQIRQDPRILSTLDQRLQPLQTFISKTLPLYTKSPLIAGAGLGGGALVAGIGEKVLTPPSPGSEFFKTLFSPKYLSFYTGSLAGLLLLLLFLRALRS